MKYNIYISVLATTSQFIKFLAGKWSVAKQWDQNSCTLDDRCDYVANSMN